MFPICVPGGVTDFLHIVSIPIILATRTVRPRPLLYDRPPLAVYNQAKVCCLWTTLAFHNPKPMYLATENAFSQRLRVEPPRAYTRLKDASLLRSVLECLSQYPSRAAHLNYIWDINVTTMFKP